MIKKNFVLTNLEELLFLRLEFFSDQGGFLLLFQEALAGCHRRVMTVKLTGGRMTGL